MLKLGGEEAEGGERIAEGVPGEATRRTRAIGSVAVGEWSDEELDELIEQAVVDAYGDDEQRSGFLVMIEEELALPSQTQVLGVSVAVVGIEQADDGSLLAVCRRGRMTQRIGVLDLPLPVPAPAGARWIEAYHRWAA